MLVRKYCTHGVIYVPRTSLLTPHSSLLIIKYDFITCTYYHFCHYRRHTYLADQSALHQHPDEFFAVFLWCMVYFFRIGEGSRPDWYRL